MNSKSSSKSNSSSSLSSTSEELMLSQPVYNSSLKLIRSLNDLKSGKREEKITINESQLESINEKVFKVYSF